MTGITSKSPPTIGQYTFSYIVMTGEYHGYVVVEAPITDNLTIYGKSDNFSMNGTSMSVGEIILKIPGIFSGTAIAPPSATARPTPGFEALFSLAAIVYLATMKKGT